MKSILVSFCLSLFLGCGEISNAPSSRLALNESGSISGPGSQVPESETGILPFDPSSLEPVLDYILLPPEVEFNPEVIYPTQSSSEEPVPEEPVIDTCIPEPRLANGGILLLDPVSKAAFDVTGNGVTLAMGALIVNSDASSAGFLVGNALVSVGETHFVGDYQTNGNAILLSRQIETRVSPVDDPLRFLPPPSKVALPIRSTAPLLLNQGEVILEPGLYLGGISITGTASVELQPGTYYLSGGGLRVDGKASLRGDEILIYNEPQETHAALQTAGQGTISLSAKSDGPYKGILYFQDRESPAAVNLEGQGDLRLMGTFYAAFAPVKVAGIDRATYGSMFIAYDLAVRGNGIVRIEGSPSTLPRGCDDQL